MADQPAVSPERIFGILNAYQRSAALKTAVELDLFTQIAEGYDTVVGLHDQCNTSERGIRILCNYLVVLELLVKDGERYALTPESSMFLSRGSQAYLGDTARFLLSPHITDPFANLTDAVRKGGTAGGSEGSLEPEHPMWVDFARSMIGMVTPAAHAIADLLGINPEQECNVLDVAAGHGVYGITIAQRCPKAKVVALDWPNVLKVALENAQRAGVMERYRTIEGSAFEVEFGSGYDVILLTNFFHHFDISTCESLMRKVRSALHEDGRAVTLEFIPNEDRVSPPIAAGFSLTMLAGTPAGDAYTFSEYERMFQSTGFSRVELESLPFSPQQVVVAYP